MTTYHYIAATVVLLIAVAAFSWWRERRAQKRWREWYAENREQIRERSE